MKPLPVAADPGSPAAGARARFLLPALLGYAALVLILLLRHEMWQDEWQAWLIARDSLCLPDLFWNLRYDGHPALWHLGLFLVTRVTHAPLGMQLLHLLAATAAVYVFLKYAPFTRLQKILFILGYFPFYEYAVISRNYALGVLGLFSFCALFCRPGPKNYLLLGLILFLLCQASFYGLLVALVLGGILVGVACRDGAAGGIKVVAAAVLVLAGIVLSLMQVIPSPDSSVAVGWNFTLDLHHFLANLATVWKSYVPLPAPDYHFWDTNLISHPYWQALFSIILLAFGLLLFLRRPLPLFLYVVGTAGILAFTYSKYPGSIRHHGHLYLLFIASLWLASASGEIKPGPSFLQTLADFCQAHRDRAVTVILAAQLLAGVWAASLDLCFPFSASQEAARFMQQHRLDRLLIVGHTDDAASSVAGYLDCRLYYPSVRGWGSFIVQNRERKTNLEPEELVAQARELSRRRQQDTLLLLNQELPPGRFPVIPLHRFTHSLVPVENYYLYLVRADG